MHEVSASLGTVLIFAGITVAATVARWRGQVARKRRAVVPETRVVYKCNTTQCGMRHTCALWLEPAPEDASIPEIVMLQRIMPRRSIAMAAHCLTYSPEINPPTADEKS